MSKVWVISLLLSSALCVGQKHHKLYFLICTRSFSHPFIYIYICFFSSFNYLWLLILLPCDYTTYVAKLILREAIQKNYHWIFDRGQTKALCQRVNGPVCRKCHFSLTNEYPKIFNSENYSQMKFRMYLFVYMFYKWVFKYICP